MRPHELCAPGTGSKVISVSQDTERIAISVVRESASISLGEFGGILDAVTLGVEEESTLSKACSVVCTQLAPTLRVRLLMVTVLQNRPCRLCKRVRWTMRGGCLRLNSTPSGSRGSQCR